MSEMKLLPCPFCGGGAFLDECRERWDVSCDKCGASTDSAMDAYEAEELWNTRIASDALAEAVKVKKIGDYVLLTSEGRPYWQTFNPHRYQV